MTRYFTLKSNLKLCKDQNNSMLDQLAQVNDQLTTYNSMATQRKMVQGSTIASKQKMLEEFEALKEKLIASNEENSSAKMTKICEHGQVLMTINNLYNKVSKPENWGIVEVIRKDKDDQPKQPEFERRDFEDIDTVVDTAL